MLVFEIKPILKEKNITLTQMAKDIGISRQSLSAISNNSVSMVQLSTLNKIASYLKVPADELLIDDPEAIQLELTLGSLEPRNQHSDMFKSIIKINSTIDGEQTFYLNIIFEYGNSYSNNVLVIFEFEDFQKFYSSKFYTAIENTDVHKNQSFISNLLAKCLKKIKDNDMFEFPIDDDYINILVSPENNDFWSFNFRADIKNRFIKSVPFIPENDDSKGNEINYIIK